MNDLAVFQTALNELANEKHSLSPASLFCFSDLNREQVAVLEQAWPDLPDARRLALLQELSEMAEENLELNAEAVCRVGLDDRNPAVRVTAIRGLWECESHDLLGIFFNMLTGDPDYQVRAAAASALGRFVYLAELEELDPRQGRRLADTLLVLATSDDHLEVRRRAIESLGHSSRKEVPAIIEAAYASPEDSLKISAIFAMGRSADRRWRGQVMAELTNPIPAVRFEAVRAAGELELREALPALIESLDDPDDQIRASAIWSLSEVGGRRARQALENLLDQAGEEEAGYIQDALDNLDFMDEPGNFPLLEMDDSFLEDMDADNDNILETLPI